MRRYVLDIESLYPFIEESNLIEGIRRIPSTEEYDAYTRLLGLPTLIREDVTRFTAIVTGGEGKLRDQPGMNVTIGDHRPPPGGPMVSSQLDAWIARHNTHAGDPWMEHLQYETLHPFMDGNGRSGRALWLRSMLAQAPNPTRVLSITFLHRFYYQTLANSRRFT